MFYTQQHVAVFFLCVTADKRFQPKKCYRCCLLFIKAFCRFLVFIVRVNIWNWSHWLYFELGTYINGHFPSCDSALNHNRLTLFTFLWLRSLIPLILPLLLNAMYHEMLMLRKDQINLDWKLMSGSTDGVPAMVIFLPYASFSYAFIFIWMPLSHSQVFIMASMRMITIIWYSLPPSEIVYGSLACISQNQLDLFKKFRLAIWANIDDFA